MPPKSANTRPESWLHPDDFKHHFVGMINVEGNAYPRACFDITTGLEAKQLTVKARCKAYEAKGTCPDGVKCPRVHFKRVSEDGDHAVWREPVSVGNYEPTVQLIHLCMADGRGRKGWRCTTEHTKGACHRGTSCTFLHMAKRPTAVADAQRQLKAFMRERSGTDKPPAARPNAWGQPAGAPPEAVASPPSSPTLEEVAGPTQPAPTPPAPKSKKGKKQSPSPPPQSAESPTAPSPSTPAAPATAKTAPAAEAAQPVVHAPAFAAPDIAGGVDGRSIHRACQALLTTDHAAVSLDLINALASAESRALAGPMLLLLLPRFCDHVASAVRRLEQKTDEDRAAADRDFLDRVRGQDSQLLSVYILAFVATRAAFPTENDELLFTYFVLMLTSALCRYRKEQVPQNLNLIGLAHFANTQTTSERVQPHLQILRSYIFAATSRQPGLIVESLRTLLHDIFAAYTSMPLSEGTRLASDDLFRNLTEWRPLLENQEMFAPASCAWTVALLLAEQHAQRNLLHGQAITDCVFYEGPPQSRPAVTRFDGPDRGVWVRLELNPVRTVSFQQWQPALFIGQRVTVLSTGPDGALSRTRFVAMRFEAFRATLALDRGETAPQWAEGTQLRVTVEHNPWFVDNLIKVAQNERARRFIDQLESGELRSAKKASVSEAELENTSSLELNQDQLGFVSSVLCRPRLAVAIGPPGTGKTHSIVGAIEQIAKRKAGRVLACATTTYAANVLALFVQQLGIKVFRVFTRSTSPLDVRDSQYAQLLTCSSRVECPRTRRCLTDPKDFDLDSTFAHVTAQDLAMSHVVVTTTAHTQWMENAKVDFDFVFIDECAQALIPEAMIPLSFAPESATIVMSGDPIQLGPMLCSTVAADFGLSDSMLHRYPNKMSPSIPNNPVRCSVLMKCYRCTGPIFKLFSSHFYHSRLEDCATEIPTVRCSLAPDSSPLCFVDVPSPQHEQHRPLGNESNLLEARAIVCVIVGLLRENGPGLAPQIGVATPYKSQVLCVRQALFEAVRAGSIEPAIAPKILVGTVDQFQGQERAVVLVSVVRPTKHPALPGSNLMRGFIGNHQMTNVALSRPEALLVIFGDRAEILAGEVENDTRNPWPSIVRSMDAGNHLVQLTQAVAYGPVAFPQIQGSVHDPKQLLQQQAQQQQAQQQMQQLQQQQHMQMQQQMQQQLQQQQQQLQHQHQQHHMQQHPPHASPFAQQQLQQQMQQQGMVQPQPQSHHLQQQQQQIQHAQQQLQQAQHRSPQQGPAGHNMSRAQLEATWGTAGKAGTNSQSIW